MVTRITAALLTLAVFASSAARTHAEPTVRTVNVSGRGTVLVAPDLAELSLGVVTQAPQLADAKRDNDKKTAAVLAAAKKLGIQTEDIQLNVHISPEYEERKGSEIARLAGYRINRYIEVRLHDFAKIEPLLSEAIAGGANVVHGLEYSYTKHRERQAEVRRMAVEAAREKATQLAELNGLKLGKAIRIDEDLVTDRHFQNAPAATPAAPPSSLPLNDLRSPLYLVSRRPNPDDTPAPKGGNQPVDTKEVDIPFAPGKLAVQIVVNITFELEPAK